MDIFKFNGDFVLSVILAFLTNLFTDFQHAHHRSVSGIAASIQQKVHNMLILHS